MRPTTLRFVSATRIVELFSEGLYTSPNKAVEELVANSFDARSSESSCTPLVEPTRSGCDDCCVRRWRGDGSERPQTSLAHRHQQQAANYRHSRKADSRIGKFGIGKLATYVLANRLTHISKCGGKYYSTSMDYRTIERRVNQEIEPKAPVRLALRELTETQAKQAVEPWTGTPAFKAAKTTLFGQGSPGSWTISIMSSLKPKVHEIKPGTLGWVLRTALPLRPDFGIWLNGQALESSKEGKGLLKRWVLW